jgi:Formate/nitrite transporter
MLALSMIGLVLALSSPSQAFAVISPTRKSSTSGSTSRRTSTPTTTTSVQIQSVPAGGGDVIATTPELKTPLALYQGAVAAGAAKAAAPFGKILVLGIAAGCHIAFGAYLSIAVGGNCPGLAESNPGLQKLIAGGMGLYVALLPRSLACWWLLYEFVASCLITKQERQGECLLLVAS